MVKVNLNEEIDLLSINRNSINEIILTQAPKDVIVNEANYPGEGFYSFSHTQKWL